MRRRVVGERFALGTMVSSFLQGRRHDLLDEPGHRDRNFRPAVSGEHPNRPNSVPDRDRTECRDRSSVVSTGDPSKIAVRQYGVRKIIAIFCPSCGEYLPFVGQTQVFCDERHVFLVYFTKVHQPAELLECNSRKWTTMLLTLAGPGAWLTILIPMCVPTPTIGMAPRA